MPQYVVVPKIGIRGKTRATLEALKALSQHPTITVLDTISEDGPRLIETDPATAKEINAPTSLLSVFPNDRTFPPMEPVHPPSLLHRTK